MHREVVGVFRLFVRATWGVCDEDMYQKAIKIMNQEAKTAVFNHIMTVVITDLYLPEW
jgi:phosphoglycerol transferase MdoB-like AlkP superfamily enzyme